MAKEFFKDLPNTTTPLTSARLNGLLDGEEAMGNIVVDNIKSKNMITGWFYGGLDSTNGSEIEATGARRTGFIEVDFSTTSNYYLSGMPAVATGIRHFICAYNSSKQFLGRTSGSTGTTENLTNNVFTSGTAQGTGDIKYLRVDIYTNATDSSVTSIQLEKGNTATSFSQGEGYGFASGSNANGNYIKYNDGTMIQYGSITTNINITTYSSTSGVYYEDGKVINLPMAFVDANYFATVTSKANLASSFNVYSVRPNTTSSLYYDISASFSYTKNDYPFMWYAIGRWK